MDSSDLINYFKSNNVRFRIEVEGKASDLQWEGIKPNGDNYVKVLPEYSNKWGVEYSYILMEMFQININI